MSEKTLPVNGIVYHCYTRCPKEAGVELCTVANTVLDDLNLFIDDAWEKYRKISPLVTRPTLYFYLREDKDLSPNAFTDGRDIYLAPSMMLALNSFIDQHLVNGTIDGRELFPDFMKEETPLIIVRYILQLTVAHELIHIWHQHGAWKRNILKNVGNSASRLENDIFTEIVYEDDAHNFDEADVLGLTGIEIMQDGMIPIDSKLKKNFIQQVLEIDADCCGMWIVLALLQKQMEAIVKPWLGDRQKNGVKIGQFMSFHSYMLSLIAGAAALMFGFFDDKRTVRPFDCLTRLLIADHPIPALRFAKVDATMRTFIHRIWNDDETEKILLEGTDGFTTDIFMRDGSSWDMKNVFWAPAQTQVGQEFLTELEKGWNSIRDSLQQYSLLNLPPKFTDDELRILPEFIRFDSKGNLLEK